MRIFPLIMIVALVSCRSSGTGTTTSTTTSTTTNTAAAPEQPVNLTALVEKMYDISMTGALTCSTCKVATTQCKCKAKVVAKPGELQTSGEIIIDNVQPLVGEDELGVIVRLRNGTNRILSGTLYVTFYDVEGAVLQSAKMYSRNLKTDDVMATVAADEQDFSIPPYDYVTLQDTCRTRGAAKFRVAVKQR